MEYISDNIVGNPIASVFIFTYNQGPLVGKTIESVLKQQCRYPFEIILIDDCSKDSTFDVCYDYYVKNSNLIHLVRNDSNKGLKRNFFESLFLFCRGKYIANCGGDDWWSDSLKLERQIDYLENHPDCTLVHTKAKVFLNEKQSYARNLIGSNRNSYQKMVVNNGIAALTACFTKTSFTEFMKEVNPLHQQLPMDDYGMWIWHSYRGHIHFMEYVTCVYRILPESLSNTQSYPKRHFIEKERRDIKMFFINLFNDNTKQIVDNINLKCFLDTLQTTDLVNDEELKKERNSFFKENHFYVFLFIAFLYEKAGSNLYWNRKIHFLERIIKRFHYTSNLFL